MRTRLQPITPPPSRVFNYSLDWRFLLPMEDPKNIILAFEEDLDFSQTLEQVGIGPSQRLSIAKPPTPQPKSFPVLAMPFGLPIDVGTKQRDRVAFFSSLRHQIDPTGYFLVGFSNTLSLRAGFPTRYQPSTPRRMARELGQAGFTSFKIYGVMPNLRIPEYMFDLDPRGVRFALQNRFRRKAFIIRALRFLEGTMGWKRMSNFLPCYFVVGSA